MVDNTPAVFVRVKRFDEVTGTLQGTLHVELLRPLNHVKVQVPVMITNRTIVMTVPLREFYERQLTGRYSFPITLNVCSLLNSTPRQVRHVHQTAEPLNNNSPSGYDPTCSQQAVCSSPATTPGLDLSKLTSLRGAQLLTVWFLGCIPIAVVKQELIIVDVKQNVISVMLTMKPKSRFAVRVIIEALDEKNIVVARLNFTDLAPFVYGKVVELSLPAISDSCNISSLRSRIDFRFAKDPACHLSLTL
jgi:hypothetical protein